MVNIGPVGPQGPTPESGGVKGSPHIEGEKSFKDILEGQIGKVNQYQQEADLSLQKFKKGELSQDEVIVAFRKAQIAFEMLMQIRNKVVDAFEEIQRMRI